MVFWHPTGAGPSTRWWSSTFARERLKATATEEDPHAADCGRPLPVGEVRPLGQIPARTCSRRKSEQRDFAIKPMNCPCHVQVFNQGLHSYRDLPLRLAEFGSCHRNEPPEPCTA